MNFFLLLQDNILCFITDSIETINILDRELPDYKKYYILINNTIGDINNDHIFKINHKIDIKIFPRQPVSNNNELINNYADYCITNKNIKNNIDKKLFDEIKINFDKILENNNINLLVSSLFYLENILPTHILYNYKNTSRNFLVSYLNKFGNMRQITDKYLYKNDLFIQRSHIFEKDYKYNSELTAEKEFWIKLYDNNFNIDNYFINFDKNRKIHEIHNDYLYVILVHPHGWYNFGEFLDAFQKLYIVDDLKLDKSKIKLVLHHHSRVVDMNKYLYKLGYVEDNLFIINDNDTYWFKKCLYIPPMCYPARLTQLTKTWFIERQINKNIINNNKTRLYLNRNNYTQRKVNNNDEVLEILKPYNFIILNGTEDLDTTIELFKNAEIIIGPHGSMFRNNIYCLYKPLIIEFCSKNRRDYSFFDLAQLSSIPYLHILSECDKDNNIIIDIDILKKYLLII